jgi:hypothetical protein
VTDVELAGATYEDVVAIQNLKARYVDAVDGGWGEVVPHDPEAVVELFVVDGIWDSGVHGGGIGHDGIRAFMATGEAIMPFAYHHLSSPRIQVDGDTAAGRWHGMISMLVEGKAQLQLGVYDDEFVRTPDGWRFKRLQYTVAATTLLPHGWNIA